mmetsp:Transcript_4873/g.10947  ORF Transcript_4873/g.10947 Transcript_4873/m.10947 type:complete len:80 (+) Transcript_4873:13-252(+)
MAQAGVALSSCFTRTGTDNHRHQPPFIVFSFFSCLYPNLDEEKIGQKRIRLGLHPGYVRDRQRTVLSGWFLEYFCVGTP